MRCILVDWKAEKKEPRSVQKCVYAQKEKHKNCTEEITTKNREKKEDDRIVELRSEVDWIFRKQKTKKFPKFT
jgi:hypothetical protein